MKLVKFERPDGSPVWINPNAVVSVSGEDGGKTKLVFDGPTQQTVRGNAENVVDALHRGDE